MLALFLWKHTRTHAYMHACMHAQQTSNFGKGAQSSFLLECVFDLSVYRVHVSWLAPKRRSKVTLISIMIFLCVLSNLLQTI